MNQKIWGIPLAFTLNITFKSWLAVYPKKNICSKHIPFLRVSVKVKKEKLQIVGPQAPFSGSQTFLRKSMPRRLGIKASSGTTVARVSFNVTSKLRTFAEQKCGPNR